MSMEEDFEAAQPKLDFNINAVPDPLKQVAMNQFIDMSMWLFNQLEKDDMVLEMLTWSKDRIKKYEQSLIDKHEAERG